MNIHTGIENKREQCPWGWWEEYANDPGYRVKRIVIAEGQRFSLQYHAKRSEHWVIVMGDGLLTLCGDDRRVTVGDMIYIPKLARHRLKNVGHDDLIVIETQLGFCDEKDIVRIEDDYGRVIGAS